MRIELNLSEDAALEKTLPRARHCRGLESPTSNPERGLIGSNKDGVYQLYAWDRQSNDLRQVTDQPAGVVGGQISADGESIYYLQDNSGDEIGHYVRVPFEGGAAEDITPDLPPYASHYQCESASGNALGFTAAGKDGFRILLYNNPPNGDPIFSARTEALSYGPILSHGAEIAVIASTEKTGVNEYALAAYDVASGELIAELWDGAGSGIDSVTFSPLAGDMRLAGSSNISGFRRPFIWNPLTDERHDIESEHFAGALTVWAWSPDGARLLPASSASGASRALYLRYCPRQSDPAGYATGFLWPRGLLPG